jgi:uncharacterized protein (TIGR04255 family)
VPDRTEASLAELFPPSPRVVYEKAPLSQVVCQLRFPQILRIESQPPADFQDRIKSLFPLVERVLPQLPANMPPELAQMIGAQFAGAPNFMFQTEDKTSTINLVSNAISFKTTKYERWERYCELFIPALEALIDIYGPSFFERIGLRYINSIDREKLDIADTKWVELLRPEILGELSTPGFETMAVDLARNIRLLSPDGQSALFLQHGFIKRKSDPSTIAYRLDFDFYRDGKTEIRDARDTINHLNSMVGRAFRWCITDTLHNILGPSPI